MQFHWHVWRLMLQNRKIGRDRNRRREEEEKRWSEKVCVSVPLRHYRRGPNVGKVAQCLSHDPWGETIFLLGPRLEMRHHRKPREVMTNISAHHDPYVAAGTETISLSPFACPQLLDCSLLCKCKDTSHIPIFMKVKATHPPGRRLLIILTLLSHSLSHMLRLKYECLCILKNSNESVNVEQELQLVNTLMVSLNMVFRGQIGL